MNSFLISICLMFSSLPYCNVEKLTNDEFAQSFGFENFDSLNQKSDICGDIALDLPEFKRCKKIGINDSMEEQNTCSEEIKNRLEKFKKNIQSKEWDTNNCQFWYIHWGISGPIDKVLSQEYERRKKE